MSKIKSKNMAKGKTTSAATTSTGTAATVTMSSPVPNRLEWVFNNLAPDETVTWGMIQFGHFDDINHVYVVDSSKNQAPYPSWYTINDPSNSLSILMPAGDYTCRFIARINNDSTKTIASSWIPLVIQ